MLPAATEIAVGEAVTVKSGFGGRLIVNAALPVALVEKPFAVAMAMMV